MTYEETCFFNSYKILLHSYNYSIIRYLYSYNYTLTNFGLPLAFIGLFLNSITFCQCTFAIQK